MTAIRTNYMRVHQARQFLESFSETNSNNYFMFLGKVTEWANEPEADVPFSSFYQDDRVHWNDMIGGERITATDAVHMVRRHDWTSGAVYVPWNDRDSAIFTKEFYVMTDENNVYKCINNNSNAASVIKPTGTGSAIISTADGYEWKYLYTIDLIDGQEFLVNSWMPVRFKEADDGSDQWDVQQAAIDGTIDRITVTNGGVSYSTATVEILGDGTGATATATIVGDSITDIEVTDYGSGYTYAEINITGDGAGATAIPILSPAGGHGSNALLELGAYYVMVRARFEQDEGGTLPITNDFRKVGLLKDPYDYGTTDLATLANFNQTTPLQLDVGAGTFEVDEEVVGQTSGAKAKVVRYDSDNRILYVNEISTAVFEEAEVVQSSSATGTISSGGVGNPDLEPTSGEILYIDQRAVVSRAEDQIETIKTIFTF